MEKLFSFFKLFSFAGVPLLNGPDIADHPRIYFTWLFNHALGTGKMFAGDIAVMRTDREGWRQGDIGQMEFGEDFLNQIFDALGIGNFLSHK